MKITIYILMMILVANNIKGQVLEGKITDPAGKPVNAISVYIPELKQGLISDENGLFRIVLEEGNYTLLCSSPEYKEVEYRISILSKEVLKKEFLIERDVLNFPVSGQEAEKEASRIMKECSEKSRYYFDGVKWYKATNYVKGKLTLKNVHSFTEHAIYKVGKVYLSDFKDRVVFRELLHEVEYFYPGSYKVNIKNSIGDIPEKLTRKIIFDIQNGSIYSDRFGKFISPLSPSATVFYRFGYAGYFKTGTRKIHKIQIESKVKDPELLNGYLYIHDGEWTINYAVLESEMEGMKINTVIVYNRIQADIHLPVTYYNDISYNLVGIGGEIKYYTAVKYNKASEKQVIHDPEEIAGNKTVINSFLTENNEDYWDKYRLQPSEHDSVVRAPNTIRIQNTKSNLPKSRLKKIIRGDYVFGNDSADISLKYSGIKMIFRDYNYVDGFWLGNELNLRIKSDEKKSIEAFPYIYYVTGRNRILAGSDIIYNYNKKRRGQAALRFGSRSEDFNNLSLTRYQNYFTSLFLGENYNFFYQRDFLSLDNRIHLNQKFRLSASAGIEKRHGLTNSTDFNLLNRNRIKDNIFPGDRFDYTYYSVGLSYSPRSNYSITEALEMHANRITPVFHIEYRQGFSSWQTNNSKYQKLKGGISHSINLDYFNTIDYKIESGVFLNRRRNSIHFTDYQHFGSSDLLLNLNSLFDSFLLLDNYEIQTNRYWANMFLNYSGKYVLLKHIPFLQGKPFTENFHIKTLFTPDVKSYIETGYSISFNRYFGVGIFTSFHNAKMKKAGVRFSLNLRSLNLI